ncbi:MAG: hypothetical protein WCI74_13880 [Actinomycetes bacterium]
MMELDLELDLNSMDGTGLPWAFTEDARDPSLLVEGNWIVVARVRCAPWPRWWIATAGSSMSAHCGVQSSATATCSPAAPAWSADADPESVRMLPGCPQSQSAFAAHWVLRNRPDHDPV